VVAWLYNSRVFFTSALVTVKAEEAPKIRVQASPNSDLFNKEFV
jgi:hypothetical protein